VRETSIKPIIFVIPFGFLDISPCMNVNVNLRHLRYLVTLSESSTFAAAAKAAGITQSTLSAAIQGLEAEFGHPLIDRSGRRMQLLPFGEAMVRRARHILAEIQELPEYAAREILPLGTRLRLGVIPSVAPFVLPKLLSSLSHGYPQLHLRVREGLTQSLLTELSSGRLDAAFIAHIPALEGIEMVELAKDPFYLAVKAGHPLTRLKEVTMAQLAHEPLLLLDQGHCLREHAMVALGRDAITEENDVRAASLLTLVQLVEAGMGITLLPKIAHEAIAGTRVQLIPYAAPKAERTLVLVWRKGAVRADDYRLLAAHIRAHCLPVLAEA
jgi:LysR family transcriptional regulator, hydrogen peroxide-inducible genes activator